MPSMRHDMALPHPFLKLLEWSLIAHGVLHIVELISAILEEAYVTAGIAAFGAVTVLLGGILFGHTHPHTHLHARHDHQHP